VSNANSSAGEKILSDADWENVLDIGSSIPASGINACADQALESLRHWRKDLLPNVQGRDLLWERAGELGLGPSGQISANGSCRLMPTRNGWLALNLARDEDWALVNPWLEQEGDFSSWVFIEKALSQRDGVDLLQRGRLMGLPVALVPFFLGEGSAKEDSDKKALGPTKDLGWFTFTPSLVPAQSLSDRKPMSSMKVVDLSALWAGPLCAHLLHQCGMQVTSVASLQRPDGARIGSPKLFEVLHEGHTHLSLDFTLKSDLQRLATLLCQADVVIEGSRPRALQALGLDRDTLAPNGRQLWLSLTAYGRSAPFGDWVGFGDDVAIAGGLLSVDERGCPEFVADAVADPLTGIYAALAVATLAKQEQSGLLDLSLFGVARHCLEKIRLGGVVATEMYRPTLRC